VTFHLGYFILGAGKSHLFLSFTESSPSLPLLRPREGVAHLRCATPSLRCVSAKRLHIAVSAHCSASVYRKGTSKMCSLKGLHIIDVQVQPFIFPRSGCTCTSMICSPLGNTSKDFTPCATVYRSPGGVAHLRCVSTKWKELRGNTSSMCNHFVVPQRGSTSKMCNRFAETHFQCATTLWFPKGASTLWKGTSKMCSLKRTCNRFANT
jgi:hypothetical protein